MNFDPGLTVDETVLGRMNNTMTHRGPDGDGIYQDGNFAMAHRRLSIIDLDAGRQPLSNEDGTVWVSFNGEIYNYLELIPTLKRKGHHFRTNSDTEVLVHLYEEKGERLVEDLRGMFAFAIWDSRRRRLILARDRVGKKPIYYAYVPGKYFIFGSEIKALLASGAIERKVDYHALDHYLSFLYVPGNASIFQGIAKLPAAHVLVCENGGVRTQRYWDLHYPEPGEKEVSEAEYTNRFQEILQESVRIRMRSDVPLGAFLSGGIDSSSVVSVMQDLSPQPVETVSVGFAEDAYNELPYAKEISTRFGCHYNEFIVKPDIQGIITQLVRYFDEPFADSSAVPTYYVSKAAREKVTVALSGDGGDETMAGYSRHALDVLEHTLRKVSRFLPPALLRRLYHALPEGTRGRNTIGNLAERPDEAAARKHYNLLFNRELKNQLYSDKNTQYDFSENFRNVYNHCTATDPLNRSLYLDIWTYLIDDILVKVDRMSMANSLEVRAPLLDHKLLEFLATVPPKYKRNNGVTKYLLKQVVAQKLPQHILTRKKQGFRMPIEVWLRGDLKEFAEDMILGRPLRERGIFSIQFIESMWHDFLAGKRDYAHHIWQLLILEIWYREYIDNA
ncbi:asparagine synthase (glutamine-hydrolyzing) [Desulfobulbus alkaliphilus]|nr:asparagine synthase (glutamine-hydrolyzing) [Desulfobulbus alkaliphilus]